MQLRRIDDNIHTDGLSEHDLMKETIFLAIELFERGNRRGYRLGK